MASWPLFEELSDSPQVNIDRGGNTVERRFKVARNDLITFVQYLCDGGTSGWSGTPAPSAVLSNTYLSSVKYSPWSGDELNPIPKVISDPTTTINEFAHWLVTASYTLYPFNLVWPTDTPQPTHLAGTTLSLQIRGSKEYKTFAARFLRWSTGTTPTGSGSGAADTDPVPIDMPARILIPMLDFVVEWDLVLNPPIARFMSYIGRCNSASFIGCAAQTIVLDDYDVQPSMRLNPSYPWAYKCVLNFKFRYPGWNYEFRESPPGWAYIITADGKPRYPPVSFAGLFL